MRPPLRSVRQTGDDSARTGSSPLSDHQVEQIVGRLLQIGVLIAAVVVILGGAMLLATSALQVVSFSVFRGEPAMLRSVSAVARGASTFNAHAVIQLGLVLLVATPIARVALTLIAFLFQRDRLYVIITSLVLALLLFSLLQG